MELEMRPVTDDELPAFVRAVESAFGFQVADEELELWSRATDPARTLAVFDDGEIVGNAGSWEMEQTLPGGATVPVAGVTAVGVSPTHRRQGLLNRMMGRLLDDAVERGESLAILTASESVIYGRYGFGWGTSQAGVDVDCRHSEFLAPAGAGGRMRRIDKETVLKVAPAVFDRVRRNRVGEVSVPAEFWELFVADFEHMRNGMGQHFYAMHESDSGEPDGFVAYRYKHEYPHGNPASTVGVSDLLGDTPEVEAAIFRYLLDLDLVTKVHLTRPVDDHLRWRMADPRRYMVTGLADHIWVRLLDVAAALSARTYTAEGSVAIRVHDRFRPQTDGVYVVEGGPDGAVCTRSGSGGGAEPDIEVAVEALGSAYLGGVPFTFLAQAGRCNELRAGGLRRADAMFVTETPPYSRTGF